jgi:hypothetical protein
LIKKEIDFRRFANRQILKEIHEHQKIVTRELNKKIKAYILMLFKKRSCRPF